MHSLQKYIVWNKKLLFRDCNYFLSWNLKKWIFYPFKSYKFLLQVVAYIQERLHNMVEISITYFLCLGFGSFFWSGFQEWRSELVFSLTGLILMWLFMMCHSWVDGNGELVDVDLHKVSDRLSVNVTETLEEQHEIPQPDRLE